MNLNENIKPVPFDGNYSLFLKLNPQSFKTSYGYVLTIKNGTTENSIKYEVEISYLKTIPEKARLFKIERTSKVYLNNTEPDLLIDKLANEAGTALYPMVVEINFDGKFLSIHNYEEIKSRWEIKRIEITDYFTGELAEKYCGMMDKTMSSLPLLNQSIQKDIMICTYFYPLYKSYANTLKVDEELAYPLAGSAAPVLFNATQTVNKHLNNMGAVEILHDGLAIDERSMEDIQRGNNFHFERINDPELKPVTGKYTARYLLHPGSNIIRSINAEWILDLKEKQTYTVSMHEIASAKGNSLQKEYSPQETNLVFIDRDDNKGLFSGIWKSLFG